MAQSASVDESLHTTVTAYLTADHRRLDAIMAGVEYLLGKGRPSDGAIRFEEFATGLDRHIEMEEQILFPVFESTAGAPVGPIAVMRNEHVAIRRCLQEIRAAFAANDEVARRGSIKLLKETLGDHNMKEERILYPMSDQIVGGDTQSAELVRKMRSL